MWLLITRTCIYYNSILVVTVTKEHCHLVVWNLCIQQTDQDFRHNTGNMCNVIGCEKWCKMIKDDSKNWRTKFRSSFGISDLHLEVSATCWNTDRKLRLNRTQFSSLNLDFYPISFLWPLILFVPWIVLSLWINFRISPFLPFSSPGQC